MRKKEKPTMQVITRPAIIIKTNTFLSAEDAEKKQRKYLEQYMTGVIVLDNGDELISVVEPDIKEITLEYGLEI